MSKVTVCRWVEHNNQCSNAAIVGKSYCNIHHRRVYLTLSPEMADHIIEQELSANCNFTESLTRYKLQHPSD